VVVAANAYVTADFRLAAVVLRIIFSGYCRAHRSAHRTADDSAIASPKLGTYCATNSATGSTTNGGFRDGFVSMGSTCN